jgi:uncharacterized delta-60 repeat protein
MSNNGHRRIFRRSCRIEHLETRSLLSVAGSLDTSFGAGLGSINPNPGIVLTEPDGEILIVGTTITTGYVNSTTPPPLFELQLFHADGSPDTTFGTEGTLVVPTEIDASIKPVSAILRPDGKVDLVYVTNEITSQESVYVAQFSSDGTLDPTFGTGGIATLPSQTAMSFMPAENAIALQSDGEIVLAGVATVPGTSVEEASDFAVVRLTTDGTLDSSFGTSGEYLVPFDTDLDADGNLISAANATAVAVESDGQIVVAGSVGVVAPSTTGGFTRFPYQMAIAQISTSATAVFQPGSTTSVSSDGSTVDSTVILPAVANIEGVTSEFADSIALEPNGQILVAGIGGVGSIGQFILDRINSDGTVDSSFGDDGQSIISLASETVLSTGQMVVQSSGEIAVSAQIENPDELALLWFTSNGTPDPSISNTTVPGLVAFPQFYGTSNFATTGLAIEADGNLLLSGPEGEPNDNPDNVFGPFIVASVKAPASSLEIPPADFDGSGQSDIAV